MCNGAFENDTGPDQPKVSTHGLSGYFLPLVLSTQSGKSGSVSMVKQIPALNYTASAVYLYIVRRCLIVRALLTRFESNEMQLCNDTFAGNCPILCRITSSLKT